MRITKHDIFHYVYAVLHHPAYRAKYARNLKREFPRIPFYDDFWQWAEWGEQLMALHLDYEQVAPFPLAREDRDLTGLPNLSGLAPKPRLIARKEAGVIEVDTATTLAVSRPKHGNTGSAPITRWNGCSNATKSVRPKTRRSARSSTPTALPTTRSG